MSTSEATFESTKSTSKLLMLNVTDSIKHFTGFDISGKVKELFDARGMGIDVDANG
jgi:lysyl-tRNA synthetase class 2